MYEPTGFAQTIFAQRYAINDKETYVEACERVAKHIAVAENGNAEKWAKRFTEVMANNKFIPGGRIWYGSVHPHIS